MIARENRTNYKRCNQFIIKDYFVFLLFLYLRSTIKLEIIERIKYGELSLGEIVVNDFRVASLFSKAGLGFCCGGKKTLNQACYENPKSPGGICNYCQSKND
jgi:hypothetical protein